MGIKYFQSWFGSNPTNPAPTPTVTMPPIVPITSVVLNSSSKQIYGPDLSHYEPGADWKVIATDNAFGMTKASEGTTGVDSLFASYWKDLGATGMPRGAYHFFHPNMDALTQAKHFLDVVGPLGANDFVALDWEVTGGMSPALQQRGARIFLQYLHDQTKKMPWLYSDRAFFQENIELAEFGQYNIWMAEYGAKLMPLAAFPRVAIWQYTDKGKYKGVPNPCDGNVFYGTVDDLKKIINQA